MRRNTYRNALDRLHDAITCRAVHHVLCERGYPTGETIRCERLRLPHRWHRGAPTVWPRIRPPGRAL